MEDKELILKCENYILEEYKDYDISIISIDNPSNYNEHWMPDLMIYIKDLCDTGIAFRITKCKDTHIRTDGMLLFKEIYYILVDLNNFDNFVRIIDKHFKKSITNQ